ncbi:hypothetical protein JOC77_003566 [Peribacillus deserti]|uniref:Uncharacterized protein n=1 Tax=Peribacillus deserti TaxID=673318 RepID=A0ABS2QLY2_9BACI|nr:hypothetical protein [Peribacillus deserti]MBM7694122.1 hypothetical protein [Peribacillus deserti]
MTNHSIEEITSELIIRSGKNIPVLLENRFPDGRLVGGKYNLGTRSITMYIETVKEQCHMLFGNVTDFLNYYAIVLAHEIGHAMDEELQELADRLNDSDDHQSRALIRKAEETAWEAAREILFDVDEKLFSKIKEVALSLHD